MEKIAFKLNNDRKDEILDILESLGGIDSNDIRSQTYYTGADPLCYYIDMDGEITVVFEWYAKIMGYSIKTIEDWNRK